MGSHMFRSPQVPPARPKRKSVITPMAEAEASALVEEVAVVAAEIVIASEVAVGADPILRI